MTIAKIPLRTLLALFELTPERRLARIRSDARAEVRKQTRPPSGGGDFHSCFWADAKGHAAGELDLMTATASRIANVKARARLYPQLAHGFLIWWQDKRRWINEEILVLPQSIKAPYSFHEIDGTIEVENLLALNVGTDRKRLIYPYFSERPVLSENVARMGLWLLGEALPGFDIDSMRILDVIRCNVFSVDRHPLTGREGAQFVEKYARMLDDWRKFVREFS